MISYHQIKSNQIPFIVTSPPSALVSEILMSVLQTVQKNNNNLHMDRQCKKNNNNLHMDSTYLQTVQKTCAKYTYIYSVHIVYYKDILSYRYALYTVCTHLHYVHYLYIVLCEGATDYKFTVDYLNEQKIEYLTCFSFHSSHKWLDMCLIAHIYLG